MTTFAFFLGLFIGSTMGIFSMALCLSSAMADEHASQSDQSPI